MNAGSTPVRLKLAFWESIGLKMFLEPISHTKVEPATRNATIVLMEFAEKFYSKCFNHGLTKRNADINYQIPLSVARILHYRLQHHPTNAALQSILRKIDQQLTNRGAKPSFKESLEFSGAI